MYGQEYRTVVKEEVVNATVKQKDPIRDRLAKQTEEFLQSGGKIQRLDPVYTGYVPKPRAFVFSSKHSGGSEQERQERIGRVKRVKRSSEESRSSYARKAYADLKKKNPKIKKKDAAKIIAEKMFEDGIKINECTPYSLRTVQRYLSHA